MKNHCPFVYSRTFQSDGYQAILEHVLRSFRCGNDVVFVQCYTNTTTTTAIHPTVIINYNTATLCSKTNKNKADSIILYHRLYTLPSKHLYFLILSISLELHTQHPQSVLLNEPTII